MGMLCTNEYQSGNVVHCFTFVSYSISTQETQFLHICCQGGYRFLVAPATLLLCAMSLSGFSSIPLVASQIDYNSQT